MKKSLTIPVPSKVLSNEEGKEIIHIFTRTTSYGADIHLIVPVCDVGPEELAMVQALYSRSPASIITHLKEVVEKGAQKFMDQFYKGYGHKSIGDLGHVLIAYEKVSMLAVKAIQDSQLYAGQEASTRYIDFSEQPFLALADDSDLAQSNWIHSFNEESKTAVLQEKLRTFYLKILPIVQEHLKQQYPWEQQPEDARITKSTYERAIKARSFDIVRGWLPAGATTMAAWYSSISHTADHLSWLRCHPLHEVRELTDCTQNLLEEVYPASFKGRTLYPEREAYKSEYYANDYYLEEIHNIHKPQFSGLLNQILLCNYKDLILNRPVGQELPYQIGECGTIFYEALLDFASFRDQQRHRAVVQRHGLVTDKYGFHEWYMNNLPDDVRTEAEEFLENYLAELNSLELDKFQKQYMLPMGMKIPTRMVGPLGKMFYLVELRAHNTVHPTMHANAYDLAMRMCNKLADLLNVDPSFIPLKVDEKIGEFSLKRGNQTILKEGKEL